MLKWFFKYNKVLLVVFGVLLMISFTVGAVALDSFFDGVVNIFRYGRSTTPGQIVGELPSGERLTTGDERLARMDIGVMSGVFNRITPGLEYILPPESESLAWALQLREAEDAGIWVSDTQVAEVMAALQLNTADQLFPFLQALNVSQAHLERALRHWLMIEQYRLLLTGQAYTRDEDGNVITPVLARLPLLAQAARMYQAGAFPMAQQYEMLAGGSTRISRSLIQHLIADQQSQISGRYIIVTSDQYLSEVEQPTEQQLNDLFNQYKNTFEGESDPYGFGYKYPTRIKIEALTIRLSDVRRIVRDDVEDDFVGARRYYEENRQLFVERDQYRQSTGKHIPFEDALPDVLDRMTEERAAAMAERIGREIRSQLSAPLRDLPSDQGYLAIPSDQSLPSLRVVIENIEEAYSVTPIRLDSRYADQWVDVDDLMTLPRIGVSGLLDMSNISILEYVMSARELDPVVGNPLIPRRLQIGVPSDLMQGTDGSISIFRLRNAQPAHPPASLDEVRDQVHADALRKAAYEHMLENKSQWLARLRSQPLSTVASDLGVDVLDMNNVTRRYPSLPGVPRAQEVIRAMFDLADELDTVGSLASVDHAERTGVAPANRIFSLIGFQLDRFEPVTRTAFNELMQEPYVGVLANISIPLNFNWPPMSLQGTIERTGFIYERDDKDVQDEPNRTSDLQRLEAERALDAAAAGDPS